MSGRKTQEAPLPAEHAPDVGGPHVAAADLAKVHAVQSPEDRPERDRADYEARGDEDQRGGQIVGEVKHRSHSNTT